MSQLTDDQATATVRADMIPARFDISAAQTLHFPEVVLADIQRHADDIDRAIGWCLWMAWCIASLADGDMLERLDAEALPPGPRRAVAITMPLGTWRHLTRQAERLDRSKSWLLARAWLLARPRFVEAIAKLH